MLREAFNSLYGAYRLARFDAGGMAYFETTVGGFWRSFAAAALVAPLYAMMLVQSFAAGHLPGHPLRVALIEAIAYVIGWVVFPLVMAWLVKVFEREERYIGYIVAYNWAAVLQNGLFLPLVMATETGGTPGDPAQALVMVALVMIMVYDWFIARTALDIPASTAAGLVILDLVLGLLVSTVANGMI